MAFIRAYSGAPQAAVGVQGCWAARGYLFLRISDAANQVLAQTNVQVEVGAGAAQAVQTDAQGLLTLEYDRAQDYAHQGVRVSVAGQPLFAIANTQAANVSHAQGRPNVITSRLALRLKDSFALRVRLFTRKPGANVDTPWLAAWSATAPQMNRVTTPQGGLAAPAVTFNFAANNQPQPALELDLPHVACQDAHVYTMAQWQGFIGAQTQVRVGIDGGAKQVRNALGATQNGVTTAASGQDGFSVTVTRPGAVVEIDVFFQFEQYLIIGEGTYFEYAVGLAAKFGEASDARGFKWVVATQYDVSDPAQLPTSMTVLNWSTGVAQANQDQRANMRQALAKNLIRHAQQMNATAALDWQGLLNTYGAFDACVFNNPHVGYGLHMTQVMGLTAGGRFATKNGMAVSVYTLGGGNAMARNELVALLGTQGAPRPAQEVRRFSVQHAFVRTNGANCMNHQNVATLVVPDQYDPTDCAVLNQRINQLFVYSGANAPIGNRYGRADEFGANDTQHFASNVETLGMQGYLLRCYRHFGMTVLKTGGWLYVNGSAAWANELTQGFNFGAQAVAAMNQVGRWNTLGTFVHYNTNFTSTRHHPSWYSKPDFRPGEPNINQANAYGVRKP